MRVNKARKCDVIQRCFSPGGLHLRLRLRLHGADDCQYGTHRQELEQLVSLCETGHCDERRFQSKIYTMTIKTTPNRNNV